jgi:tetratricopeptide (TPR) repeat protein
VPQTPSPAAPFLPVSRRSSLLALGLLGGILVSGGCAGTAPGPSPAPAAELSALERRAARDPGDVAAAVRLGAAYRAAGRLDEARRVLEAAHARAPRDDGAALFLGLTYEDRGDFDAARGVYEGYARTGGSRRLRGELRDRLALLERRAREAEVRAAVAQEARLASAPPTPNSVAVFPFIFGADDESLRPLERALAEFLVTDLAATGRLRVLERARVQMLLDEIALGAAGRVDPATAARGGRLLRAAHVVQGHIGGGTRALELQARVARVTPEGAAAAGGPVEERGGLSALFTMQKELALGVYRRLGVELTAAERDTVLRRPTENLQAVLAFGRGLEAADAGDFAQAARHFLEAAVLDPGFAAARVQAAQAAGAARAAGVTTAQLAVQAAAAGAGSGQGLDAMQALVPSAGVRDPAAEALGGEGFRGRTATVELIFRRP